MLITKLTQVNIIIIIHSYTPLQYILLLYYFYTDDINTILPYRLGYPQI